MTTVIDLSPAPGAAEGRAEHVESLAALGLNPGDAARLAGHGAFAFEDARVLIQDLGCPPSLAADILLSAWEEAQRP